MVKDHEKEYSHANIAILLATYNGEKYIEEQLNSIKEQTYQEFVCFIHDDVSSDHTVEIIEKYCMLNPQNFVFLGSHKCGGAKQNFFYMMSQIDAEYIMFCDQDDVWFSTKVEKSLNEIKKLEGNKNSLIPLCVYSDVKLVDKDLNVLSENYLGQLGKKNRITDLLKKNVVIGCTMMVNKKLADEMKSAKNLDNIYMHDWWGGLIGSLLGKLFYIQEPLMLYRQHDNNAVGASKKSSFFRMIKGMSSWGKWCNEKKEWLTRPRKMAEELIKIIPTNHPDYEFLRKFAFIGKKSKIERMIFYIKNDMIITSSNIIFQLIFI